MTNDKYDLIDFRKTYYSQYGEEGIIEKILEELEINDGFFVEFGASDGFVYSATKFLADRGWRGIMIEPEINQFKVLKERYRENRKIKTLPYMIQISGENCLDNVLNRYKSPKEPDFISIDVDGNDYHIWESLELFYPKIVQIESNFSIPFNVEFVQKENKHFGSSALAFYLLGLKKGYKMVAYNLINCIFVRADLFSKLKLSNSSFAYLFLTGAYKGLAGFVLSDFDGNWYKIPNDTSMWGLNNIFISNSELPNHAKIYRHLNEKSEISKLFLSE